MTDLKKKIPKILRKAMIIAGCRSAGLLDTTHYFTPFGEKGGRPRTGESSPPFWAGIEVAVLKNSKKTPKPGRIAMLVDSPFRPNLSFP